MRMDENINPEWVAQCKGSSSGRKALDEIERLTEQNERQAKLLKFADARSIEDGERVAKLEAVLATIPYVVQQAYLASEKAE